MRLKLAVRNTFRNTRRTLVSVWMIAGGMAALVLFQGFSDRMISTVRNIVIQTQFGHIQLASDVYWENTASEPRDKLLPGHQSILEVIAKQPAVAGASGRLSFFALISAGEVSTSAQGLSLDPAHEASRISAMNIVEGKPFSGKTPYEALVGVPLARQLGLRPGDSLAVLSYTFDGVVNALDLEVAGLFSTGLADVDKVTFFVPLQTAQRLLDTENVEKIVVDLTGTEETDKTLSVISSELKRRALPVQAKGWLELATFFKEVESFYRTYDRVIEVIVLTLILLGIMNTVGMAIYERTGEIGTLRALGFTEKRIVQQFTIEGGVLGVLGCGLGTILSVLVAALANAAKVPMTIPGASAPVAVQINLLVSAFFYAAILVIGTAVVAAYIPARRATKKEIVEALRHNV